MDSEIRVTITIRADDNQGEIKIKEAAEHPQAGDLDELVARATKRAKAAATA